MARSTLSAAVLALCAVGCTGLAGSVGETPPSQDAGVEAHGSDAGNDDAGAGDAGAELDAGIPQDAGQLGDAGIDAGSGSDGGRDLSADRSRFFGASRCAQANFLLCDDFEGATLDQSTWTVTGTQPVIDTVHAARGSKALHLTRTGSGSSYISETKTFPVANNTYFGRMFVYFKSLPTPPGMSYAHWTIAAASGTGTVGEIRVGGQLFSGANWFGVGTDSQGSASGTGDWTNSDQDPNNNPRAVPLNEWICLEWMHKGDTNETRFYWDGVEHPSLYTSSSDHGGNTNPYILPTFDELWVGWSEYQSTSQTFELWIDEVAVDGARIGCIE